MSPDERAKYLAIKNDTLGLYLPPPRTNGDSAGETIEISAADDSDAAEPASPASTPPPATADLAKAPANPLSNSLSGGTPTASAGAASAPPGAEGNVNTNPPTLTFRTGTQVVALDVVITDSKGHVVKGLQQSDFSIGEDGKPQVLRHFREY